MDRALKERIIGAVVLVVFVVLVVPVFLDGPPREDEVLSERVPLPGQSDQPVKVIILDRDRSDPVPSSVILPREDVEASPPPTVGAEQTENGGNQADDSPSGAAPPATERKEPEPVAAPAPSRPDPVLRRSDSATGMWAVQLGSFSSEENANRLAANLRKEGFAAFLSKTEGDSGMLHRVRVGPQKDRPAAEAMASRLAEAGQKGQVVPHP